MSTNQVNSPNRLGLPCWTAESLAETIRPIAQVDAVQQNRFLTCHAPITHLSNLRTDEAITEAQLYEELARSHARENLILVRGNPGTGKSHLINWIKLRYDHAISTGEMKGTVSVLIQRRSGSLRDALQQLVDQLPERFRKYLDPVRAAIERISQEEARRKLADAIALELSVRWRERRRPDLPRHLRELPEAFRSTGFAAWLCRPEGVIDRNVQRLINPSEVHDRESIPGFAPEEFEIVDPRFKGGSNTAPVRLLIDDLEDDLSLRNQAAEKCNLVLRDALREVTGLGNAQLTEIFRSIRRDLKQSDERLALFIEDVSTLSALDDEVVNAVEPQNDTTLCPLTAVLGLTSPAYTRLPQNQLERATFILTFGAQAHEPWGANSQELDQFAARYLNAIRLTDAALGEIAGQRREGGDVRISACSECSIRDDCHKTFGFVELGEASIGLFPFSPGTPARLFDNLNIAASSVERTQRGLLQHIVVPILEHAAAVQEGHTGAPHLPVLRKEPAYWTVFSQRYCGGWSANEQSRLRLLCENWIHAVSAADAARELTPFLKPLNFPAFTERVSQEPAVTPTPSPIPTPAPPPPATLDGKIEKLRSNLDAWLDGGKLQNSNDAQTLLWGFLKSAIPFADCRSIPAARVRDLLTSKIDIIRIEESATRSAFRNQFIDFPRDQITRNLILALAHFEYQGNGSWNFESSEIHKRNAARWLRQHQDRILKQLEPPLDISKPLHLAVQFLRVAAVATQRARLPDNLADSVSAIVAEPSHERRTALSPPLQKLFDDLPGRQSAVRSFLLKELDVPQGAGGCVTIDPWPIARALYGSDDHLDLSPLSEDYFKNFWKSRYEPLANLRVWGDVSKALVAERAAIEQTVNTIAGSLNREGYYGVGDVEALDAFFSDLSDLVTTLRTSAQAWSNPEFDTLYQDIGAHRTKAVAALRDAQDVLNEEKLEDVLIFDASALREASRVLDVSLRYVATVRRYADDKIKHLTTGGDPDVLAERLLNALDKIAALDLA